jgi:putative flippase GtrA
MTLASEQGAPDQPRDGIGPHENEAERNNRNLTDLIQELRVATLGIQVLFGFLLSLPFTVRFTHLNEVQRDLYRISLLCAAAATALLVSPVGYHRWVFRRHEKERLLRFANAVAILGLVGVALAVICAVWLVLSFVGLGWLFSLLASIVTGMFVYLWFALPIFERAKSDPYRYE